MACGLRDAWAGTYDPPALSVARRRAGVGVGIFVTRLFGVQVNRDFARADLASVLVQQTDGHLANRGVGWI